MDKASSRSSGIPSLVRQLNDSVYELHRPPGMPSLQVLFFHGFQLGDYEHAHLSTWESRDGSCIWPQKWLAEEFPEAHILSVSYHASLMKSRECANIDLFIIGENIMSDLMQAKIGQEVGCQVILVGHSFGGLVMKEVCLHAQKKGSNGSSEHKTFLKSVKGLFFYATPHRGIAAPKLAERFVKQGPLLGNVKTLSTSPARLHDDFENLKKSYNWRTGGVGECLPTKWSLLGESVVVEEASSRYGDEFRVVLDADHISVCKPKEKTSTSFNTFTRFLGGISKISKIPGNFQRLPKSIVGVDCIVEEIKANLRTATSLGLVGMGGIGKTTLAKVLFNDLESHYDYSCFLKDVKSRREEVVDLVLKNIHFRGKDNSQNGGGLGRLSGERLLLVLDDVSSEQDLEIWSILRDDFLCHRDSRVVVTSRDSELLGVLDAVHVVPFLSPQISKQLLQNYAFPKGIVPSLEACVDPVVQKCSGLPLTLEVVGKYLYQKSESIWEQVIQALDRAEKVAGFDEKLWAKLKLSYDSLDKEEQKMFLDAATVFFDKDLDDAKAAWSITTSGLQDMRWRHLIDLSLVREVPHVDWWGLTRISIGMHEQLLCLGRKLGEHGESGRTVWAHNEQGSRLALAKVHDMVDIQEIVGLRLFNERYRTSDDAYEGEDDDAVEYLSCEWCQIPTRLIVIGSVRRNDNLCVSCFAKSGRHTSEHSRINNAVSEPWSQPGQARLRIRGDILRKMGKLQYLHLWMTDIDRSSGAELALPSTLVYLFLGFMNFDELPFNPSHHSAMVILVLYCCDDLLYLPTNFGELSCLQTLRIRAFCLRSFPDSLGRLSMLKYLGIYECAVLEELPETLGELVALENLTVWSCGRLSTLPQSIGQLKRLKFLVIKSFSP